MFLLSFFLGIFVRFVYFDFNIWHAAVAYYDGATIELMRWRKMFSDKIQKIISDFCFDTSTKWRIEPNSTLFSISFVVADILV